MIHSGSFSPPLRFDEVLGLRLCLDEVLSGGCGDHVPTESPKSTPDTQIPQQDPEVGPESRLRYGVQSSMQIH